MTGATFLLAEINNLKVASAAAKEVGIPISNIFVLNYRGEDFNSELQSWTVLLAHGENDWIQVKDPSTAAAYVSTSGTSGLPKAAVIPHSYLISQGQFQEKHSRQGDVCFSNRNNLFSGSFADPHRFLNSSRYLHFMSSQFPSNIVCRCEKEYHAILCPVSCLLSFWMRSNVSVLQTQ